MERNTKQKQAIIQILRENATKHMTAVDILAKLNGNDAKVSKATLYRELARLCSDAKVRKYVVGEDQGACYQYVDDEIKCNEHYHLVCYGCNKVVHTDNIKLENVRKSILQDEEFEVKIHNLVLHGVCKECKNKEKNI